MPNPVSIRELAQKASAGDRDALARLIVLHHSRLVSHIAERLPAPLRAQGLADDVAQETYAVAFREIARFEPRENDGSFFAWVARIAEHRMQDMLVRLRAAKRGGDRNAVYVGQPGGDGELIDLLGMLAVHSHTPSRSVARVEALAAVREALERLDAPYREALRLRYLEELPIAEVAARMGRGEGAVLMLCNRALKKLRRRMGDAGNFLTRIQ